MLVTDARSSRRGQQLSEFEYRETVFRSEEDSSPGSSRAIAAELLSAVMSLIPDAAVVADAGGRIVSVNGHAEELFGYAPGSLAGLSVETLIPERARRRHQDHRARYVADPQSRPMGAGLELTGRRRDGTEFAIDVSLAPMTNDGERLVVAAIRDITEQRRAAAAQAELASIVGSSSDAIISTTLDGRVTNWNGAAEDLFGYEFGEIMGKHIAVLVPAHASPILEDLLGAAAESRYREALDTRWRHRDGREVDVSVSISPLKERDGTLRGFSSIVRDNAERKSAENELRRLLAEEERLQRQHAVASEIRLSLLAGASLDESLMLICRRASELVDAPVAFVSVKDPLGIRIVAGVGPASQLIGLKLPAGHSFAEEIIEHGESNEILRRNERPHVDLPDLLPDGPTLGVPIIIGGTAAASLTIVRDSDAEPFNTAARVIAEALGAQTTLAFEIERARRVSEQNVLAGDRERIARDLHDHVIQRLFAAGLGLQASLSWISEPAALARITEAVDVLDETIREIRNTIFSLSMSQEYVRSVRSQISEVVREVRVALEFEPRVEFIGREDATVPIRFVPHVVACVREGLSNVARHAHASEALVQLIVSDDSLIVIVTDDGVGIGSPTRSSGLGNLDERAKLLGGKFQISNVHTGGTQVTWTVPLGP
jgi:PAS domain S-box-containing protein